VSDLSVQAFARKYAKQYNQNSRNGTTFFSLFLLLFLLPQFGNLIFTLCDNTIVQTSFAVELNLMTISCREFD
jgi:hypothetical protein